MFPDYNHSTKYHLQFAIVVLLLLTIPNPVHSISSTTNLIRNSNFDSASSNTADPELWGRSTTFPLKSFERDVTTKIIKITATDSKDGLLCQNLPTLTPYGTYNLNVDISSGGSVEIYDGTDCVTDKTTSNIRIDDLGRAKSGAGKCTQSHPCPVTCMGPCLTDGDCAGSLECFQRNAKEAVPGCYDGAIESLNGPIEGNNYCYDPQIDQAKGFLGVSSPLVVDHYEMSQNKIFDGECTEDTNLLLYDSFSGTIAEQKASCLEACTKREKTPLSGSWDVFGIAAGFVISPSNGGCFCENVKSTCSRNAVSHVFKFEGECDGTELRMYEGGDDKDNEGTFEEQRAACQKACLDKKSPLNSESWNDFTLEGYIISNTGTGRCFCEGQKSSEPECNRCTSCTTYNRYDIVTNDFNDKERYDIIAVYKKSVTIFNKQHRFQASPTGIVSVGIRAKAANTDGALFKSVKVYEELCTPLANFVQALAPAKFPFATAGNAGIIGNKLIMPQPDTEQVFSKNKYTGNDAEIEFRSVLLSDEVGDYCASPLSKWNECWGSQDDNKNTRMYNMDTNTWTTSVIQAAKRRYGGLTVGCAGLIWSFGGYASSGVNKAGGIHSEIWTWTGDPNDSWDTTTHKNIPDYGGSDGKDGKTAKNGVCWKDAYLVCMRDSKILQYDIAAKSWSTVSNSWVPGYSNKAGYGFKAALWNNKYLIASARDDAYIGTDGLRDKRAIRVFNLETKTWEERLSYFPMEMSRLTLFLDIFEFNF